MSGRHITQEEEDHHHDQTDRQRERELDVVDRLADRHDRS